MIRILSNAEAKEVARFFDGWAEGLAQEVLGDHDLAVVQRGTDQAIVLLCQDLLDLPHELLETADHAGLRIGTWEEGLFAIDLQGAIRATPHTRKQIVKVSEKAAQMFVYGKDIIGTSVVSFDPRLNAGDTCIVCNPRWEAMGIGEVMGRFKGPVSVISAIHDLGAYLRDQD